MIRFIHIAFVYIALLLSGCIGQSKIDIKVKNPKKTSPTITVSNIQVVDHQIIITGTNLDAVSSFNIKEGANATDLKIESQTNTSIVANTISNVSFAVGSVFDFVLSTASAASTYTVNFSLCDSTLGTKGFNCSLVPNDRDVLSYDAATGKWAPRAVNGLAYQGMFDASAGAAPASINIGDYYIINVAGTIGSVNYSVGDWIVLSSVGDWEKINNSNAISSIFGRTGAVVAAEGDYSLDKLSDVDLTVPPVSGDVLKYDGTKWSAGAISSSAGGTVTSVSGTAPISVATGTVAAVVSISAASTSTNGYLSSTDWNTFNNKISGTSPTLTGTPIAPTAAPNTNTTQVATTAFVMGQAALLSPLAGSTSVTTLGTITTGTWNGTAIAVANGGTGSTTAADARTALGIGTAGTGTIGALVTNIPVLGTGGISGTNLCGGDNAGGIICTSMTSSIISGSVSDETGAGALVFGTSPTISSPVIANIAPAADFTLTQNAVVPFTSVNASAVANTLYLKAGSVGMGTANPAATALLDMTSTTKGILIPRMDTTARNAIASPATGLQIYNTTTNELNYYNGSGWLAVGAGGSAGTVTSVTSANADIAVATTTTTPVLTLNSGTGANQIIKLNGSSQLPAVDGSLLTLLDPTHLSAAVAVAKGGTGSTTAADA